MRVWPFDANDDGGVVESYRYKTDIMQARSGLEQRVVLRQHPEGGIVLPAFCEGVEAGLLESLMHGAMGELFAVPLWQWMVRTTAPAAPGDHLVQCPTAGIPFYDVDGIGIGALLWRSPTDYEFLVSTSIGFANEIDLDSPNVVAGTWPTGSIIVPCRAGRLNPSSAYAWLSTQLLTAAPRFDFENTGDSFRRRIPALPSPIPVFEFEEHSRDVDDAVGVVGRHVIVESGLGARGVDVWGTPGSFTRTLSLRLFGRSTINAMRTWLDERLGRAVPFYYPTREANLTLASAATSTSPQYIVIKACGYTELQFPFLARRKIRIWSGHETRDHYVTTATNLGDGTESLRLDSPLGGGGVDPSWTVSFLLYCRLDDDNVEFRWHGTEYAEVELPIREIGVEAPVP